MGEIPERRTFNQIETREVLRPYFYLTQAVRNGDLQVFNQCMESYGGAFKADKNFTLVQRLSHNVLKTGLRKLSLAYSRIAIMDIATKLRLPSAASAEYVCAKAIRDGVIDARIDHENGWLITGDIVDLYTSEEPQKAFHKRIAFCLDVHNEAVKSMRYPPDAYKKEIKNKGQDIEDEKTIEELIKEMEDDMGE
jgi:26S proteasome regulatory subunit N3